MKRFLGVMVGLLVPAAFLALPAGAAVQVATGDTCTASGSGTSYTLVITLPATAPDQGGFAFGAPGATVTNVSITGDGGTFSTAGLPASTTGEWTMGTPARAGSSVTAVVGTSGPTTGSFSVVAEPSPPSGTAYDPIVCTVASGTPVPKSAFTVGHVSYVPAAKAWHLGVTVPGAGTVSGIQAVATAAGVGFKQVAAKFLIMTRKVVAKSAGSYTLALEPTAAGSAALAKSGSITIKMTVAFNPKNGKAASKVLTLALKR